jgi:ABC-type transport system involved in multi-copper enzyme maturation permease subunit
MNRYIARALLEEAFYQVLDNKVFRLLAVCAFGLVAITFLIGFRPDGIHLLFGWKTITYQDWFETFGMRLPKTPDLSVKAIQGLQEFIVQWLSGTVGILFCVSATAFFIPRMLEKGAADTLFSKPVSRFLLLFARYIAGVVFVAVLSFLLVLGMHVGLLVTSGYSDPGFLWGALTLVYVFALVHGVSTVVAVFTRSSVAAILCTLMFFVFNGCVQMRWVIKEHGRAEQAEVARNDAEREGASLDSANSAAQGAAEVSRNPFITLLAGILDAMHYALPKTNDADVLTRKLRTVVAGGGYVLHDQVGQIAILEDPRGFDRISKGVEIDLSAAPAIWIAKDSRDAEIGRITLTRRNRVEQTIEPKRPGDKPRKSRTTASSAANDFMKSLAGHPEIDGKPTKQRDSVTGMIRECVRWTEKTADEALTRERYFMTIGADDWMFELDVRLKTAAFTTMADEETVSARFVSAFKPMRDSAAALQYDEWYERTFGWSAPLKYNAFFSIGTSLLFLVAMLGLSGWRLARIDF